MSIPRILIIAGSDSGGGAGIQADIKTVTMLGGHALTAISALTAQNTMGVTGVMPVPAEFVRAQIDAVVGDIGIDAVKIGMIGSADIAAMLADWLPHAAVPVVLDPVMVATSGAALADQATLDRLHRLLPLATLVTPNLPELGALTGDIVEGGYAHTRAARKLARASGTAVLAKGGHGDGAEITDLLVTAGGKVTSFTSPRIDTRNSHGTGCTLASAIAVGLAERRPLAEAVQRAGRFVRAALLAAPGLGEGHGPMGHGQVRPDFDADTSYRAG